MDLRAWERPIPLLVLTILVIVLGVGTRLPAIADADEIEAGHPDARTYFWKAVSAYSEGRYEPLPHGGSGWPLFLSFAFGSFGVERAPPSPAGADLVATGEATLFAYALHAMLAAGLVVATLLLARLVLRPLPALAAAAFVAVDPFLLGHTTDVMADALYAILFLLALACVVRSRGDARWLAGAGALMGLAHMVRVNGLVMLGMVVAFAMWEARASGRRLRWRHALVPLAAFLLVAAPYLAWRADHLPGAFDYGTNQRFWTDDPWNMTDAYWTSYTIAEGGPRESMSDYFGSHTGAEAIERLFDSGAFQIVDLVEGRSERAVLALPLVGLAAAGIVLARGRPASRMWALALAFTALTFVWIYPVVRSPRYFLPLVPLAAILAAQGVERIAARFRRPALAVAVVGVYVVLHGAAPLRGTREGLAAASAYPSVRALVFIACAACITLAAWPLIASEWRARPR